jgi:hypothetical protein
MGAYKMKTEGSNAGWNRWAMVVLYAVAMAWVEAAVVFYLRTMIGRIEPFQPNPLPLIGGFAGVELVREAATLAMLFAVGYLAGPTWPARWGYAAIAFGVWDIFYYVFLRIMCGWPHGLLDWDILFLLPLPWWGPVAAPMMIALLMIVGGTFASQAGPGREDELSKRRTGWKVWGLSLVGAVLALYVFMADALAAVSSGIDAVRGTLPGRFHWPLIALAWLLMATPMASTAWRRLASSSAPTQESTLTGSSETL